MTGKDIREGPAPLSVLRSSVPLLKQGRCYVMFAFELGLAIDLDGVAQKIKQGGVERSRLRRNRKSPTYFDYDPPPLRIIQHGQQVNIGKFFTKPHADMTLFDFGACSVMYEIEISGPIGNLIELSEVLYDNGYLLADARDRVTALMQEAGSSIERANLSTAVEDFAVYHLEQFDSTQDGAALIEAHPREFARLLRAESDDLADEEVRDAVATRTSYSIHDCAVVDWNGALFFGSNVEDVVAVLEFCNVELLEMRFLDEQLDDYLESAYALLMTGKKGGADLHKVARLQVDSAILYEAVENALKLLGDQYLARLYSLASVKFHLPEWNSSILRKLDTLDSIYQKLSDRAAQRRSEGLEWIIIVLIALEILFEVWKNLVK
jgi:hypothetical protein